MSIQSILGKKEEKKTFFKIFGYTYVPKTNFYYFFSIFFYEPFPYHILLKFNSEVPACLKYVATSKYLQRRKYILIPLLYNCQKMYPEGLIWIRLSWGGTLSVGTSRHSDGGGVTLSHDCNDNAMVPTFLGQRGPL